MFIQEQESNTEEFPPAFNGPEQSVIRPGSILVLNKANAKEFHEGMKAMIQETGCGLFEYLETIKFFEKVKAYISGDKQAKIPEDKQFVDLVRTEILKYEKGVHTTPRGVKFETCETGTAYDFSQCNDQELLKLQSEAEAASEKLKARKEFLKTVAVSGLDVIDTDSGEVYKIYPPSKTSNSSYKITMK